MSNDACFDNGISTLGEILLSTVSNANGSDPGGTGAFYAGILIKTGLTISCELPPDIENNIKNLIIKISDQSYNVVLDNNILYIVIIFITLLLLTIFIFLAIYMQSENATWILAIISIIVIIIAAVILFLALYNVYLKSFNNVKNYLTELDTILTKISGAIYNGVSCASIEPECTKYCKSCI
jgi:hypothetical protein